VQDPDRLQDLERRIAELEARPASDPVTPPPWYFRNPIASKVQQNALSSTKVAVTQEVLLSGSNFTTTNTTDWQDVGSFQITIPKGQVVLYLWSEVQPYHSAASAECSIRVALESGDGIGTVYVMARGDHILLAPTAGKKIAPVILTQGINVPANLPLLIPGRRLVRLQAFNHTAGTLTLPGATDQNVMHALLTGDSTR
jgi:hypothetical protein